MRRADADGNQVITFDELYELLSGQPIDPLVAPLAAQWAVLKSPETAATRWERWGSLLIAPQVKRLSQISAVARRLVDRIPENFERSSEKVFEQMGAEVPPQRLL